VLEVDQPAEALILLARRPAVRNNGWPRRRDDFAIFPPGGPVMVEARMASWHGPARRGQGRNRQHGK
jgi:hypothetical protein